MSLKKFETFLAAPWASGQIFTDPPWLCWQVYTILYSGRFGSKELIRFFTTKCLEVKNEYESLLPNVG